MSDWLSDHWGDLASVAGLLVSFVGFVIAIRQILRSRKAVDAATLAVLEIKERIARILTIADLTRASDRMEELKRLHREKGWELALSKYHDMRLMLADIRSRHPGLNSAQQSAIQEAVGQLEKIEAAVSTAIGAGNQPANVQRHRKFLLNTQTMLDSLASDLKQSP